MPARRGGRSAESEHQPIRVVGQLSVRVRGPPSLPLHAILAPMVAHVRPPLQLVERTRPDATRRDAVISAPRHRDDNATTPACRLAIDGTAKIGEMLFMNHWLRTLDLGQNALGDDGASRVADAVRVNQACARSCSRATTFTTRRAAAAASARPSPRSLAAPFRDMTARRTRPPADDRPPNEPPPRHPSDPLANSPRSPDERRSVGGGPDASRDGARRAREGVGHIADALAHNRSLTCLSLAHNRISPLGAAALARRLDEHRKEAGEEFFEVRSFGSGSLALVSGLGFGVSAWRR